MSVSVYEQEIVLRSSSEKQSNGQIKIQTLSQSQRLFKAFINGFIVFTCSLATIVIPVFHLILFPLGLMLTVVSAIKTYSKSSIILGGEGPCPECNKQIKIFKRAKRLPFEDICENCRRQVKIESK